MKPLLKPIKEQVIVITGASSGIGLATAKLAHQQGAKVVLAARDKSALDAIVAELNGSSVSALAVEANVSNRDDVARIAQITIETFGRFDTWVNNAGVSILGEIVHTPVEDLRTLFETNFWGTVYGSLTAVEHLKQSGGALINLGSTASDVTLPLQGMYSASKHAVKGFTDALRIELENAKAPISLTLIKPSSINTPFTDHARNYMPMEVTLPAPVYTSHEVAHAILSAAEKPVRDVFVGGGGRFLSALNYHAPEIADWFGQKFLMPGQQGKKVALQKQGSLDEPVLNGRTEGHHPGHVLKSSLYTRAALNPIITFAALAGAASAGWLTYQRKRKKPVTSKPSRSAT